MKLAALKWMDEFCVMTIDCGRGGTDFRTDITAGPPCWLLNTR